MPSSPTSHQAAYLGLYRRNGRGSCSRRCHPDDGVTAERKHQAVVLLDDVVRSTPRVRAVKRRMASRSTPRGTALLDIYGVGPVVASIVLGHVGRRRDGSRAAASLRQLRRRRHRSKRRRDPRNGIGSTLAATAS